MTWGFPGGLAGKESASEAGDSGSIPGSGRSPEERNGSPLQDSCLGNLMDRRAWRAAVHAVAEWDVTKQLSLGWFKVLGGTRRLPLFTPPHLESLHPFTASRTFSLDISLPGCFSALSSQLACYLLRKPSWNMLINQCPALFLRVWHMTACGWIQPAACFANKVLSAHSHACYTLLHVCATSWDLGSCNRDLLAHRSQHLLCGLLIGNVCWPPRLLWPALLLSQY